MRYRWFIACLTVLIVSCTLPEENKQQPAVLQPDTVTKNNDTVYADTVYADTSSTLYIRTGSTRPEELVNYAQTLIGVPYVYASSNPAVGFDCSGFITYVFNHFNITVPRSSVDFTNVPYEVPLAEAKPADLILFTGTDSTIRVVGHMGIIVSNNGNEIIFIHSTSGKAHGVTLTTLNDYYRGRFVKVIRVFPQDA
jgi:cell wall-associated NlpC family hydrolase